MSDKNLALNTYNERLKNRDMKEDLSELKEMKEILWKLRLNSARKKANPPWTMDNLDHLLKNLKRNKSRDPMGYANKLFHPNVAGDDLKKAILSLINRIKSEQ